MKRHMQSLGIALFMSSALTVGGLAERSFAAENPAVWTQETPSNAQAQAPSNATKTKTPSEKGEALVWVNIKTGRYHKKGSRWYGKTKKGKYMLEEDAIRAGYKPEK